LATRKSKEEKERRKETEGRKKRRVEGR